MKNQQSRRKFLQQTLLASSLLPFASTCAVAKPSNDQSIPPIYLFSKHLQFLEYENMANKAAEIGFDGVELTVRPKGHVLPERVKEDLPTAIAAIQKAGLQSDMIVTKITDLEAQYTKDILTTAANLGVQYYRMGYYKYPKEGGLLTALAGFKQQTNALAAYNKTLGIKGIYQNHAGVHVGSSIWEVQELLSDTNSATTGCQFDIRHAQVEGGLSWPKNLRLIQSRIQAIVTKDYKWEQKEGKWKLKNVPIGEGMVDFVAYFKLLQQYGINVPISLHLEYDLGGAEHGDTHLDKPSQQVVFKAMKQDLDKVRMYWEMAQ